MLDFVDTNSRGDVWRFVAVMIIMMFLGGEIKRGKDVNQRASGMYDVPLKLLR